MKNIFSKLAGSAAVVAIAMTLVVAPTASALTAADIQLLVSMGVIPADKAAAAMAALGGTSTSTTSCGSYTRDLTLGSTGADVVSLQSFLESKGVLSIPAGTSKGYFGALTQSALAKYQASVGISPAAGYFGPMTRAKVSGDCSTTGTPTTPGSSDLSGGEASLENFDLTSGDDSDIEEDSSGDIAEIEFDVEDGDVMLDRVDLAFVNASTTDTTDVWDVLETVELVLDGDVIGEADLSDEDDYLDEDDGTVRISGIDAKIEEGETATIIVRVTVQSNVDTDDQDTFTVNVETDGIRATDSEGIQQYVGSASDTVDFDIDAAGADEELNVSSSSNDPDATTLKVEDNAKSDLHPIFTFDLEAEENDIEIDTVEVTVTTGSSTRGTVSDYVLEIDGEEFDDWEYTTSSTTATSLVVSFDIDKEFTVEADSEVEVTLHAEFNAANGTNFSEGNTIVASIADGAIEGEGADDVVSDGTATGETHTLRIEGIDVPATGVTTSTRTSGENDTVGIFVIEFEVTAFEEDFYIANNASSTDRTVSTGGVEYTVPGAGTTTATLASTADENSNVFEVSEGETETFTLTVTFDPTTAGQYRLTLDEIWASTNSNGITGSVVKTVEATDFRTAYENIN